MAFSFQPNKEELAIEPADRRNGFDWLAVELLPLALFAWAYQFAHSHDRKILPFIYTAIGVFVICNWWLRRFYPRIAFRTFKVLVGSNLGRWGGLITLASAWLISDKHAGLTMYVAVLLSLYLYDHTPPAPTPDRSIYGKTFKPLESDHWGERPTNSL